MNSRYTKKYNTKFDYENQNHFGISYDQNVGGMILWCIENFGVAGFYDNSWETWQHQIPDSDNEWVPGRVFIFHSDIEAMAFKLRWE